MNTQHDVSVSNEIKREFTMVYLELQNSIEKSRSDKIEREKAFFSKIVTPCSDLLSVSVDTDSAFQLSDLKQIEIIGVKSDLPIESSSSANLLPKTSINGSKIITPKKTVVQFTSDKNVRTENSVPENHCTNIPQVNIGFKSGKIETNQTYSISLDKIELKKDSLSPAFEKKNNVLNDDEKKVITVPSLKNTAFSKVVFDDKISFDAVSDKKIKNDIKSDDCKLKNISEINAKTDTKVLSDLIECKKYAAPIKNTDISLLNKAGQKENTSSMFGDNKANTLVITIGTLSMNQTINTGDLKNIDNMKTKPIMKDISSAKLNINNVKTEEYKPALLTDFNRFTKKLSVSQIEESKLLAARYDAYEVINPKESILNKQFVIAQNRETASSANFNTMAFVADSINLDYNVNCINFDSAKTLNNVNIKRKTKINISNIDYTPETEGISFNVIPAVESSQKTRYVVDELQNIANSILNAEVHSQTAQELPDCNNLVLSVKEKCLAFLSEINTKNT